MKIAYTSTRNGGGTDSLLTNLADSLIERGVRVRGAVQSNCDNGDAGPCDMDLNVLPDGPAIRISQSLGRELRGCRLDPFALETVVGLVGASLADGPEVLIINKFGKHEAEGRGFRALIAEALAQEIPVLVGLSELNEAAFQEFAGGLAVELAPRLDLLLNWLECGTTEKLDAAMSG